MRPKLEGYASAVIGALSDAKRSRVVEQLEAIDQTIQTRSDLRAALTDSAMSADVRSAVLRDLLTGKVDDVTVQIASYAARVTPATDLSTTLTDLTHYAVMRSRPESHIPAFLSLLEARQRVGGFADAVLETLAVDDYANVEDDLFRWARTVESHSDLRRILVDRDAPLESRLQLTRSLLEGKVHTVSLRLALYVVEGGRPRDVIGTLDFLVDYTARARDWRVARVRSARSLDDSSRATLVERLQTLSGHSVELQVVDDASLLGGVLVEIGDLRLDATTRGRLTSLHEALASSDLLTNRNP